MVFGDPKSSFGSKQEADFRSFQAIFRGIFAETCPNNIYVRPNTCRRGLVGSGNEGSGWTATITVKVKVRKSTLTCIIYLLAYLISVYGFL